MEFKKPEMKKRTEEEEIRSKMLAWPECYYREREGMIRLHLLEEAEKENLTPSENEIRRLLWERRYPGLRKGDKSGNLDTYMRAWFEFRYAADNLDRMWSYKRILKSIRKNLDLMGFPEAEKYGPAGREALYQEIHHMAMLYIALCTEDKTYNSFIMGMGKISEEKTIQKIAAEVTKVAQFVPERLNLREPCELWTKAILTAFKETFPDQADLLKEE